MTVPGRGTGLADAVACARVRVLGQPVVVAAMDFRFMGGSLGAGAGELITRAAEVALADRTPLLIVTASGGARMQEGAISLMQMAKTTQALAALNEAGVLTVSLVTDPTYGGVAASFATTTDLILAEPGARMGFAGPRVIEQTINQKLPDGFQTAEFLLARGWIDDIVPRAALRPTLGSLLGAVVPADPGTPVRSPAIADPAGCPTSTRGRPCGGPGNCPGPPPGTTCCGRSTCSWSCAVTVCPATAPRSSVGSPSWTACRSS